MRGVLSEFIRFKILQDYLSHVVLWAVYWLNVRCDLVMCTCHAQLRRAPSKCILLHLDGVVRKYGISKFNKLTSMILFDRILFPQFLYCFYFDDFVSSIIGTYQITMQILQRSVDGLLQRGGCILSMGIDWPPLRPMELNFTPRFHAALVGKVCFHFYGMLNLT